jgi:outer membrane protein OmpA-like peptidoglycan-associated protein
LICFNERCRFFVGFRNEQRRNSFDNKNLSNRPRKTKTIQDTASLLLEKRTGNVQIPLVKQKTPGIKADSTITLSEVLFEFNSYRLKQGMIPTLDSIAAFVRKESKASVNVLGHTDNSGKEDYNLTLSSQRAEVVAEFLLDRGVDSERVNFMGMGSSQPVLPNDTPEGRRKNRRVEILIRWKN